MALDGVGKFQNVNDMEVFVRGSMTEESLIALHSLLKMDEELSKPFIRILLS